ncbi:MAG: sialate O-acetylesterase [Opitutaceae bacterium]|jgi:sialate O-acetylesterase|nr:sialate O-acetylesterase [Opitutaceae bacterium]
MQTLPPLLVTLIGLAAAQFATADVVPSALFQNSAVLQRDKPVPVWGTADAGEKVTVSFAGQTKSTTTGADGRWSVTLDPLPASSTPASLTIAGNNTITLSDIVVGEVWIASGQSNMEWVINNTHDADVEKLTARYPLIRQIKVAKTPSDTPATTFKGEWQKASPETLGNFTAVGYHFAKDIHLALDVPVGIVNSSWGGTPVEAWMSPAALASDPAFAVVQKRWAEVVANYPEAKAKHDAALAAWEAEKAAAAAAGKPFNKQAPRAPQGGPGSSHAPSVLHNGMIAPLLPAALRGAIWYQGESNAGRYQEYHALFSAMISGWRGDFGQGDFPFFWAQLAAFRATEKEPTQWAFLREAQTRTLALPATGQAVIIDSAIGDFSDIHPRDKAPVGRRLARLALVRTYGLKGLIDSGPEFVSSEPAAAGALKLTFNRKVRQAAPEVTGFEVAGEDRVFHPAAAKIEGKVVVVSSPAVTAPVAVRYAWKNYPDAWMQDDLGMPVPPFRTDTW